MALLLYPELLETRTYPFQRLRYMHEHMGLQEGVYDATDYKVVQRAAGANMSVDAGAGSAWVKGETGTRQGFYHVVNDATVNLSVTAAHATLPRLDQVILRVFDSTVSGGSDVPTLSVLVGTATGGATLDNRTGAAALPNDAIRLADILVAAADTSITNSEIRDRRPWARGAKYSFTRTATNLTTTSTSLANIDGTNWSQRIECSGVPVKVTLSADIGLSAAGFVVVALSIDGATGVERRHDFYAAAETPLTSLWMPPLSAGSHLFTLQWRCTAALTATMYAGSQPLMEIAERVAQNAANQ